MIVIFRFAGSKTCIRDVAIQFSIGESTFHRQMARVMNYLVDIAPRVIKFPETEDEKATITHQFEEVIFICFSLNYKKRKPYSPILDFRVSGRAGQCG